MEEKLIAVMINKAGFEYDIHSLVKAFYPECEVKVFVEGEKAYSSAEGLPDLSLSFSEDAILLGIVAVGEEKNTSAFQGMKVELKSGMERPEVKNALKQLIYTALSKHTGKELPWGTLTGIRPTKIPMQMLEEGKTEDEILTYMQETYYVSEEKGKLSLEIAKREKELLSTLHYKEGYSLYIGIPFCPTRCSYCSFVSKTVGKRTELITPYLEALYREMAHTAKLLVNSGKKIRTIYIGGGTPTTLTTAQMTELLERVKSTFDLSRCIEFTVEGGRPDTLSAEKLAAIRNCGADRMSINPQTMEDSVLKACGRPHTAADIVKRYGEAVGAGFSAINMDLIAGLPQDSYQGFCHSLDAVAALEPANITVHTLALKKGADLFEKKVNLPDYEEVARMVDYANQTLRRLGYRPYYLYRQKYMSGSFENVGWSRNGADCLYNIYMMEELHTILSLGAGGMNKVNFPDGSLQRFHNPKFPEQYIEQLEDVLRQKEELFQLL